ncbi:hypothetical protein [Dactylosporangium sp. NPDC049140]|uniref:hypothetical protein n=1 Tax=Dactylosporangium sp. NPDC049140 TaxID=3155647 RepID=UPI0033EB3ED4
MAVAAIWVVVLAALTALLFGISDWTIRRERLEAYTAVVVGKDTYHQADDYDAGQTFYYLLLDTGRRRPLRRGVPYDTYQRARTGDCVLKRSGEKPVLLPRRAGRT